MKLFRLHPNPSRDLKTNSEGNTRDPFTGYDVKTDFVIRAKSEEEAREIAEKNGSDELYSTFDKWLTKDTTRKELDEDEMVYYDGVWTNENLTECVELNEDGNEEVIFSNLKNG